MLLVLDLPQYQRLKLADEVRIRLISQLINGISRFLQKLFRYFNGTVISTSFVPSFHIFPVIFLYLNEMLLLLSIIIIIIIITTIIIIITFRKISNIVIIV